MEERNVRTLHGGICSIAFTHYHVTIYYMLPIFCCFHYRKKKKKKKRKKKKKKKRGRERERREEEEEEEEEEGYLKKKKKRRRKRRKFRWGRCTILKSPKLIIYLFKVAPTLIHYYGATHHKTHKLPIKAIIWEHD
jgi:hypothetical protein